MSVRAGRFQEFSPPLAEHLGGGLALRVERAGLDRAGEAVISALLTQDAFPLHQQDAVLHKDRVSLGSDRERKRFVRDAALVAADLEPSRLAAALLKLSLTLPALVGGEGSPPVPRDTHVLWDQAHALAEAPDLLEQIAQMIQARGIVGEERTGLLLYLSATARLCPRPVSVLVKGASGSGKDEVLFAVLALLPPDAYLTYSSITARYLLHTTVDLRHRILVLAEAGGIARGDGAYIVRTLLSENRLRHGTAAGGGQELTKEGPTTLWTSTVLTHLDPELETRALSLTMRDDEEQNRAVMERLAGAYSDQRSVAPDPTASHAWQEWLALAGERRVHIPYARVLARQIRHAAEVRVRRDFRKVLDLIAACAMLHQVQRVRTDDGAIVATLQDYALVRDLIHEPFTAAQQDAITPQQRAAAAVVAELYARLQEETTSSSPSGVALSAVAQQLGIAKSSASRRLEPLVKAGYVRNLEPRRGRHGAFVPALPLPEELAALPTPEEIAAQMVGRQPGTQ